ncbi:hypothetical protein [Nonomuraea rubra]|uniref:hypothetical protein n=1 Tax=Nonomuraea rubra TaxID=46180 RepID=UPI0033D399EF
MTIIDAHLWPEDGATVRLTMYMDGSTLDGTAEAPHFDVRSGTVLATPRSGAEALVVEAGPNPINEQASWKGWAIGPDRITITPEGRHMWEITTVPAPENALLCVALVDATGVDPDLLVHALRGTLRNLGCHPIAHTFSPDPDTVADCAGIPGVTVINLTS